MLAGKHSVELLKLHLCKFGADCLKPTALCVWGGGSAKGCPSSPSFAFTQEVVAVALGRVAKGRPRAFTTQAQPGRPFDE